MVLLCCSRMHYAVLFSLFFTDFVFAIGRFNFIDTKFIEDMCPYNETLELFLSASGTKSAIKIKPMKNLSSKLSNNCTMIIYSSIGGVILNVDSTSFKSGHYYEDCEDYIQVFLDNKNSTKLCGFKSTSVVSEGNMMLRYHKKHDETSFKKFTIISTAYRKGYGKCFSDEFMCNTGECIWKGFSCDGMANCPDGSDEFSPENSICIPIPPFIKKPVDFDWNFAFPTSKSILEYRKTFNVTITAAIACAFLIFFFGVIRFVCHHRCYGPNSRRYRRRHRAPSSYNHARHHATLRTFSIIRSRPDFQQPQYECSPPPSYVSLINGNINCISNINPPAYSTVAGSGEEDSLNVSVKDLKNSITTDPPPPYEP